MKGDPEFVILKYSAWLDAAKYESQILGSIVRQPLMPTNDFTPPNPLQYNAHDLVEPSEPLTDFTLESTNTTVDHASAKLSSIAGLSFKNEVSESVKLAGKIITYKRLAQHSEFWGKLKGDTTVSTTVPTWVTDAVRLPPCLVVGIMIAEDVDIDFSGASQRDIDGNVELPIAKIAMAATGTPINTDFGNPQAEAGTTHRFATAFKAKSGKSNIFALELKTIVIPKSWWSRKKKLVLSDEGPEFDQGRLAGDEDDEDEEEQPTIDDLELEAFTTEDYAQMAGR